MRRPSLAYAYVDGRHPKSAANGTQGSFEVEQTLLSLLTPLRFQQQAR